MSNISRRRVVLGGLAAAATAPVLATGSPATAQFARPGRLPAPAKALAPAKRSLGVPPNLHPRSDWASSGPVGPLTPEDDVRFLLVHHTETPNGYSAGAVPARLRSIFGYHTGTKGWPDVAYNFFVDAHGQIWEGREGSIAAAVRGDATGGSQGHSILCCFVGSHITEPPTPAALEAMSQLLAWQAMVHSVDLGAGPTITFTSRGSNRWPAGQTVTTDPVAGHRDMSQTSCPGDAAYPLVRGVILERAQQLAGTQPPAPPTTEAPTPTPAPTVPATTLAPVEPTTTLAPTTVDTSASTSAATTSLGAPAAGPANHQGESANSPSTGTVLALGAGAASVAAAAVAGVIHMRRRSERRDLEGFAQRSAPDDGHRPGPRTGGSTQPPEAGIDLDDDDIWS